jgi:hypothetical protein
MSSKPEELRDRTKAGGNPDGIKRNGKTISVGFSISQLPNFSITKFVWLT